MTSVPSAGSASRAANCSRRSIARRSRPLPSEPYEFAEWRQAPGQHRLSRRHRRPLLQRPLPLRPRRGRGAARRLPPSRSSIRASASPSICAQAETASTPPFPSTCRPVTGATPAGRSSASGKTPRDRPGDRGAVRADPRDRPHPEQGYRACLGIVRLAGSFGAARVEAAAERAIEIGARPMAPSATIWSSPAQPASESSWLACALGHKACRDNRSALYQRVPKLFGDLAVARGDGRYARLLRALGGVQLLILDDWGLEPLDDQARHDLLEILEERYGRRSTIVTRQLPGGAVATRWTSPEPTYADAIPRPAHPQCSPPRPQRRVDAQTQTTIRSGLTGAPEQRRPYNASKAREHGRHHVGMLGAFIQESPGDIVGIWRVL